MSGRKTMLPKFTPKESFRHGRHTFQAGVSYAGEDYDLSEEDLQTFHRAGWTEVAGWPPAPDSRPRRHVLEADPIKPYSFGHTLLLVAGAEGIAKRVNHPMSGQLKAAAQAVRVAAGDGPPSAALGAMQRMLDLLNEVLNSRRQARAASADRSLSTQLARVLNELQPKASAAELVATAFAYADERTPLPGLSLDREDDDLYIERVSDAPEGPEGPRRVAGGKSLTITEKGLLNAVYRIRKSR